jgi:hypothetical protein
MRHSYPYADLAQPTMGTHPPVQPGRTSQVKVVLSEDEYKEQMFKIRLNSNQYLKRLMEMAYDYKNPVDENVVIPQGVFAALTPPIIVQPDYDQTEIYTGMSFSLPVGTTSAILQLGSNRQIPLYSGAAIATQTFQFVNGLTILATPDDRRQLFIQGTITSNGYFGLSGHCFEREGER